MNTIYIDSTHCTTDLCLIGSKHNTDKAPFSNNSFSKHRKGFTAVYSMLLSRYENNKSFNLAEIGIEIGASMCMWREKYPLADISMFDINIGKLNAGKKKNLPRTAFYQIDVGDEHLIDNTFLSTGKMFDVIIDDSTHFIKHQNNIINICHKYLNNGGLLIIEDIHRKCSIDRFNINTKHWSQHTFIICHHDNRVCVDNDKLLVLTKTT